MAGTLALQLLWAWAGLLAASALALWALIKLPRPVPARWEVRLFLLMGMPADQYLAFIIKVRAFVWDGLGEGGGIDPLPAPNENSNTRIPQTTERRGPRVLAPRPLRGLHLAHERLLLGAPGGARRPARGH